VQRAAVGGAQGTAQLPVHPAEVEERGGPGGGISQKVDVRGTSNLLTSFYQKIIFT